MVREINVNTKSQTLFCKREQDTPRCHLYNTGERIIYDKKTAEQEGFEKEDEFEMNQLVGNSIPQRGTLIVRWSESKDNNKLLIRREPWNPEEEPEERGTPPIQFEQEGVLF